MAMVDVAKLVSGPLSYRLEYNPKLFNRTSAFSKPFTPPKPL